MIALMMKLVHDWYWPMAGVVFVTLFVIAKCRRRQVAMGDLCLASCLWMLFLAVVCRFVITEYIDRKAEARREGPGFEVIQ